MTQVQLQQLSKTFAGREKVQAVKKLSLTIAPGQITALLGPSGCGKTTILKLIAGLLQPTGGDILFNGQSVLSIPAEKRGAVMVFQNHLLFPYLTVGENVGFGLRLRRMDQKMIQRKVAEMLERVQLPGFGPRRPGQLSGGQQQRVALARALVVEPSVLLLDEPLSNLDAHLRDDMRELIRTLQRQLNITTIFVTHAQEEAVVLADQVALLFTGEIHQTGCPRDFYQRPATVQVARFFGGVNFLSGVKQGHHVDTPLGCFRVKSQAIADGQVTLHIRPENLKLGQPGDNTIQGQILNQVYAGTHIRFKVQAGQWQFETVTDPVNGNCFRTGEAVSLTFPPEMIWLIPPLQRD